jgi:hypothetical protein
VLVGPTLSSEPLTTVPYYPRQVHYCVIQAALHTSTSTLSASSRLPMQPIQHTTHEHPYNQCTPSMPGLTRGGPSTTNDNTIHQCTAPFGIYRHHALLRPGPTAPSSPTNSQLTLETLHKVCTAGCTCLPGSHSTRAQGAGWHACLQQAQAAAPPSKEWTQPRAAITPLQAHSPVWHLSMLGTAQATEIKAWNKTSPSTTLYKSTRHSGPGNEAALHRHTPHQAHHS